MKKIVSLLVAIAMVMGLSLTAFATTTSDSFLAADGVNTEWIAPVSGEATFTTGSGTGMIAVDEGNTAMGMDGSVTFNCVEGTAYQIKHFVAGGDLISWSVEVNGGADVDATSGTVVIESYSYGDFTAPKDGTVKLTMDFEDAEMDIVIGWSYIGTIANGETINVTAGTTYSVYPLGIPGSEATLTWEYVEGGEIGDVEESTAIPSGEALALGDNDVELTYAMMAAQAPYWTYTATENGSLTVTVASVNGNSNLGMAFGRGAYTLLVGETDGAYTNTATVEMVAGETVNIAVLDTMDFAATPAVLNLAFEAAPVETILSGGALALGNNNVEITWAMMPMQAPYWTYTATEGGNLTVTVASINGETNLGMAFGRGFYTLLVGNADGMGSNTATVYVAAGETVNVAVLDNVDEMDVMIPAVLNLSFEAGEPVVEKNPADCFEQDGNGYYIIPSLAEDVEIFVGNDDITYIYTAEEAGVVTVTPTVDGYEATNCWIYVNGVCDTTASPAAVQAGDVVLINIWQGYEGVVSLGDAPEGGDEPEGGDQPAGNTMILGDNNVVLEAGDADGETYTFIATEDGVLNIDITALAYDEGFGMGMQAVPAEYLVMVFSRTYAFLINGEQIYDIVATVNVTAGDEVTIQLASPMMRYATEATITLYMGEGDQGGDDVQENLNAQYQGEGTETNPYIIDEIPVYLGVTLTPMANDLYFQYVVTEAGVISFGETEAIVWPIINGNWNYNSNPVQVAAGDVVVFNIFGAMTNVYVPIEFEAGATLPEGGDDVDEPTGPNGTDGNEFIIDTLEGGYIVVAGPSYEIWDVYYKYVVEKDGTIVAASEGGSFYFAVNSPDYDWSNPTTSVEVVAGDVLYINFYNVTAGDITGTLAYLAEGGDDNGDAGDDNAMSGTDVSVDANGSIEFFYTPDADGVLTIELSADPGFKIWVYNNATDETIGLPHSGTAGSYEYALVAGVEYRVVIIGYYDWSEAAATISYEATFEASELEVVKDELAETSVELVVGEQNVELLPNAITTLFNFYAPEAGIYTLTVPAGAEAALYGFTWTPYQFAEGTTLIFTATEEGQGFMIGLSNAVASFNVTLEKTGEYEAPKETTYINYEPTIEFDDNFELPEGDVTNVDITEAHTAVLGDDGFYHLDTVDGPILYVNLNSDGFTLATLLDAGAPITMRGEKFQDENGDLFCYDYMNMIAFGDYYSYSKECDYYPLTADLMAFFQDYGAAQGWYNANFSNFEAIKSGEFNEESAWMVALVYIADDSGNQGGNQGGNTGDNPQTSDIGIIAASVTMTLSAIVGTALLCKKKEN